jgi:hypothetical protein
LNIPKRFLISLGGAELSVIPQFKIIEAKNIMTDFLHDFFVVLQKANLAIVGKK